MRTSISHLTGKEQHTLHCIKKRIKERLDPLLIFYFNSEITQTIKRSCFTSKIKKEDCLFSCDLLIITPNDNFVDNDLKNKTQIMLGEFGKVIAFIHPLDFVLKQLNDGSLFFNWIHSSGIVLHEKDNAFQLLPLPISKRPEYREQADNFYRKDPGYKNYLEEKIVPVAKPEEIELREHSTGTTIADKSVQYIPFDLPELGMEKPRQLFPQNLTPQELANPYLVINSFFRVYRLQDVRKYISNWMGGVYEKVKWVKKNPENLIYFTETLFQLIEACWLINQMDNSKRLANLALHSELKKLDLTRPELYCNSKFIEGWWECFPRSLSEKDFTNPYKVFTKFFKMHSLNEWKEQIRNILQLSLSRDNMESTGEVINVLGYKKLLEKFGDACHLINVREFEWIDGQLNLKVYNFASDEGN